MKTREPWRESSYPYGALRALRAKQGRSRFGEDELHYLAAIAPPNRPAIDIGANLGFYTFRLASLLPSNKVLAIEPNPRLASRLRFAARATRTHNVHVIDRACGRVDGQMAFSIPRRSDGRPDSGQGHLTAYNDVDQAEELIVSTRRLDDIAQEFSVSSAGLVKIDVEGAELGVLEGAPILLEFGRPTIICEIQDLWCKRYGNTGADVLDFVTAYNYRPCKLVAGKFEDITEILPSVRNYIFFPN